MEHDSMSDKVSSKLIGQHVIIGVTNDVFKIIVVVEYTNECQTETTPIS